MSNLYNDADYIELVIKCLFRDKHALQKALDLRLEPSDFGTINIYNLFVDCALSVGEAPIGSKLCLAKAKDLFEKHAILDAQKPSILQFWEYLYNDEEINSEYVTKNLADFVKFRRYQTLKVDKINNPEELINQANKLVTDIQLKDSTEGVVEFNPFSQLVLVEHKDSLMTGFPAIDALARGLNYQEFGMILGHSGSGKTAMAVYSAIQNAKAGKKVLYLSLEEPAQNICSRVYSNIFRINYTDLHKGSVLIQNDLRLAFEAMDCREKQMMQNLNIHDLRNITPITAKYIESYLDKLYQTSGYHPDLIYIDQLDYLTATGHFDAEWQKYSKAAFEVDDLCDHLIGGEHPFSVWLLHQATGKMTRRFSNGEISGFKGIIKPTDMCLAIGRDSSQDQIVSIFSLKSRHAKNFQFDYIAELEYMNFEIADRAAMDRVQQEETDKKDRRNTVRTNFNIPKAPLLPSANSGFHSSV